MRRFLKSALARLVRLALAFPPIFATVKTFLRDNPEALYRVVEGGRFAQALAAQNHLLKGIVSTEAFWARFAQDEAFQNGLRSAIAGLPVEEQSQLVLRILKFDSDVWLKSPQTQINVINQSKVVDEIIDDIKSKNRFSEKFGALVAQQNAEYGVTLVERLISAAVQDESQGPNIWGKLIENKKLRQSLRQFISEADEKTAVSLITDALQPYSGTHHRARAVGAIAMALASETEAARIAALHHACLSWDGLKTHLDPEWQQNQTLFGHFGTARPRDFTTLLSALVGAISDGRTIKLKGGVLEFQDTIAFVETADEILAKEQYYFQTTAENPYVLDCGVNAGLAIYYVKQLYPGARVVGFEPHPPTADLARRNVERLGYADVVIHTKAIAATEGELDFAVSDNPLGHHLASAAERAEAGAGLLTVPAVPLSPFVNEPVDFLKLDIEGAEFDVLHELGVERLKLIRNMFIEYHIDEAADWERLAIVIALLRQAEFDLMVEGASWAQRSRARRPLATVGKHVSLSIYAKRRAAA